MDNYYALTCFLSLENITGDLCHVAKWCYSNQVLINPSKTKIVVFGTRQLFTFLSKIICIWVITF